MGYLKCPKCGSDNIGQERRMEGPIWCLDCQFRVEKKEIDKSFIVNESVSTFPITEQDFKPFIKILDKLEKFVFDNEKEFDKEFCGNSIWILKGITFSAEFVHVQYVFEDGQHVSDSIGMKKFLVFVNKYRDKWEDEHGLILK